MAENNDNSMGVVDAGAGAVAAATAAIAATGTYGAMKLKDAKVTDIIKSVEAPIMDGGKKIKAIVEKFEVDNKLEKGTVGVGDAVLEKAAEYRQAGEQILKKTPTIDTVKEIEDLAVKGFKDIKETQSKELIEALKGAGKSAEDAKKLADGLTKTIDTEIKAIVTPVENAGRKALGALKYNNGASWHQKPLVAFEALSTKGKVGIGAIAVGTALTAAYAVNKLRGDSHADQIQNERTNPNQTAR